MRRWHPLVVAGFLGAASLVAAGGGPGRLWLVMGVAAGFATSGST